jgi:hypothetical protein
MLKKITDKIYRTSGKDEVAAQVSKTKQQVVLFAVGIK